MIDDRINENIAFVSCSKLPSINSLTIQDKSSINNDIISSSSSIIDLLDLLSFSLKNDDIDNIEKILLDILEVIENGFENHISNNFFEPFLLILENFLIYSIRIVDTALRIIYELMTIPNHKNNDYFQFFSQPICLEYYFNIFSLNDLSIKIMALIVDKKHQIFETYDEQIQSSIFQFHLSESLINLISVCLKINPEFISIEEISIMLDELLKSTPDDDSLFCSAAELVRQIIKGNEESIDFFTENAIYYLKLDNDDIDISLIKIYNEIVKLTNDFSFLLIDSDKIFIDFFLQILDSRESDDPIISSLFQLLSHEADITCFSNYSQVLATSIKKIDSFSFKDQKRLMNFILNLIIQGNNQLLDNAIEAGLVEFISVFMSNYSDTKMTIKMLTVVGIICENSEILIPSDVIECIEKFLNAVNEEIADLASVVYQKIIQKEEEK